MKQVLVCGSRTWTNRSLLWDKLDFLDAELDSISIIHGGARGADTMAAEWAIARKAPVQEFKADWDKYRKAAGPIRNQQMIDEGKPDLVYAFAVDFKNSTGTKDMITKAKLYGIPVRIEEVEALIVNAGIQQILIDI